MEVEVTYFPGRRFTVSWGGGRFQGEIRRSFSTRMKASGCRKREEQGNSVLLLGTFLKVSSMLKIKETEN